MTTTYAEHAPIAGGDTDDNGTTTVVARQSTRDEDRRLPAFLALARSNGGLYVENPGGMTVPDALVAAGLDFTVTKHGPLSVPVDGGTLSGLDKKLATVATWADGRQQMLGVVGKGYPIAQPLQVGDFGQVVIEEGGGNVAAVASYGDPRGSRMYLALKLPEGLKVGGVDPYDLYLTLGNSWNGETSLWGCVAPIRLDCTNQGAATFGKLANRFMIRHTGDLETKVREVYRVLEITGRFSELFAAAAEKMLGEPMAGREIDAFLERLMPTPRTVKTERGEQQWASRRGTIGTLIRHGEHTTVGRGTRYAAYNGVTEWVDHMSAASSPAKRWTRLVDGGDYERLKVDAAHLLLAGV